MRSVLVILLTLLLVQPPGICVCRLNPIASGTVGLRGGAIAQEGTTSSRTCRCCNGKASDAASTPVPSRGGRLPDRDPEPDHAPGCPAHPAYAISRAALVDAPTHLNDLLAGVATFAPTPLFLPVASPQAPAAPPPLPPSRPLFLLVCDFRC